MNRTKIIIAAGIATGLCVIAFALFFILHPVKQQPTVKPFDAQTTFASLNFSPDTSDYYAFENTLKDVVSTYSIEDGFKLIDEGVKENKVTNDQCHVLLHYLGHFAYSAYQNDYDKVMDVVQGSSCIGGYVHGIEAEIVLTSPEVIHDLQSFCTYQKEKNINPGPCYHGAGHAAVELYGYDIAKSLKLCDSLDSEAEHDLGNCYRGVFSQVGSVTLGFDGDTGLQVAIHQIPGLNESKPMSYCYTFDAKYQSSCESQLVTLLINNVDRDNWMDVCLDPSFSEHTKEICLNITSVVYIRSAMSFQNSAILPKDKLNALPENLRKIALMGALEAFDGYFNDKVMKDWHPLCNEFTLASDTAYCESVFDLTVNKGQAPWMEFDIR